MHDLTVGSEWVSAAEFWRMSPGQVWWLIQAKLPDDFQQRGNEMVEVVEMVKAAKRKDAA